MRGKYLLVLLLLVAVVQLGSVGERIYRYESVLAHGKRFLFKTAPVDPYDSFRGRYVALSQENLKIPLGQWKVEDFPYNSEAWAQIATKEDGFAYFPSIAKEPTGGDEVKVRVYNAGPEREDHFAQVGPNLPEPRELGYFVRIAPPFDRYYMNEKSAPRAEQGYRRNSRDNAFIAVRVANGVGIIEDLFIDGVPVRQFLLRDENAK